MPTQRIHDLMLVSTRLATKCRANGRGRVICFLFLEDSNLWASIFAELLYVSPDTYSLVAEPLSEHFPNFACLTFSELFWNISAYFEKQACSRANNSQ